MVIYGYTGEWWGSYIELLHLRARWYSASTGTFLSVDPVESEPPYQYVRGNPVNRVDPSGQQGVSCAEGNFNVMLAMAQDCIGPEAGTANPIPSKVPVGTPPVGKSIGQIIADAIAVCYAVSQQLIDNWPTGVTFPWAETQTETQTEEDEPRECCVPPDDDDDDDDKEKHISLGLAESPRGVSNLGFFTHQLNRELNPLNIYVYYYAEWHLPEVKLADNGSDPFSTRFEQASRRAKTIHFSLEGIDDPNEAAERFGNNGVFTSRAVWTLVELYLIRERGYCYKTRFYRRDTPTITGVWTESLSDWLDFCTLTGRGRLN